jgi:hypothetical protein
MPLEHDRALILDGLPPPTKVQKSTNNGASEDSADGKSRGGGEDTDEENQASSNDDDEDDDDGGGGGGGGSEEEEEEPVGTDCGEQPCMFEEFVPNLIALSIKNSWLDKDFDWATERDEQVADARVRAMVQDPSQLQEIKQQQRQCRYTMYHQFNAHQTGGRNERTTYPKCVNIGIH